MPRSPEGRMEKRRPPHLSVSVGLSIQGCTSMGIYLYFGTNTDGGNESYRYKQHCTDLQAARTTPPGVSVYNLCGKWQNVLSFDPLPDNLLSGPFLLPGYGQWSVEMEVFLPCNFQTCPGMGLPTLSELKGFLSCEAISGNSTPTPKKKKNLFWLKTGLIRLTAKA